MKIIYSYSRFNAQVGTMESERFDASAGVVEQNSLKPETALQLDIEELVSNSSADETPPSMIIVETCISSRQPATSQVKQVEKETASEQAGCSITLGLKPNVQFQILSSNMESFSQSLANTEAALAAANTSTCAAVRSAGSDLAIPILRRCADSGTQCNNLNLDCEASNSSDSMPSIGSLVCRICHNADNPEQLVSPCLCKGSLTYVHVHCLERWISTSRCTICELCQFHYNTEQTLRYTCLQSLRLWYSRAMSRRALQEDCQMFSLLTLVAFGIIGTLLVGIQYYAMHTQSWGLSKLWTKSWMLFFLFMTITVYFANIYMLIKSQLTPWYRWWQSARDIKLILENRRPFPNPNRAQSQQQTIDTASTTASMFTHHDQLDVQQRSSQPRFGTPSSSASSLPRALPVVTVEPPPGAGIAATAKLEQPTTGTEAAIGLAMISVGSNSNPSPSSNLNPKCSYGADADASAGTPNDKEQPQQQPQPQPQQQKLQHPLIEEKASN
ncbi:E3 ubiquitin-protein ligase MARCH4 [Drosophila hydei]|uniref:E3 ubiquitin-protein ligase MARCH4 n=1 Tax=Drosophila hydei TaxID=7224 RepID=A0A6J1MCX8_DROHY|nr:E3 ubiquitin-protein ligase MARCH4 [Drosophila hydei]